MRAHLITMRDAVDGTITRQDVIDLNEEQDAIEEAQEEARQQAEGERQ